MALSTGIFNIAPGESARDVDWRRRLAAQLALQGTSTEPVEAWTQGAARIAQALVGGYDLGRLDKRDREREAAIAGAFQNLPGMGGTLTPPAPRGAPEVTPPIPSPSGAPVTPPAPRAMPDTAPIVPKSVRTVPVTQATEGAITAAPEIPYDNARTPLDAMRPSQEQIRQAQNLPLGPQIAREPQVSRQAPDIPPDVQQKIRALWVAPATRPLALQLWQQYSTPKDQWVQTRGPDGELMWVNRATGEPKFKPSDAAQIANQILANPQKYGYEGPNDPRLMRDVGNRLSGLTTPGQSVRDQADAAVLKETQDTYATALRLKPALQTARAAIERAPEGLVGQMAAQWARIASGLGLPIPEGANEAQLIQSITTQLAGLYRLPGPVSNAEMGLYMQAAPKLGDTRQANLMKIELFDRLSDRAGEIVNIVRRYAGTDKMYDELAKLDKPIFSEEERKALQSGLTPQGTQPNPTVNLKDSFQNAVEEAKRRGWKIPGLTNP